MPEKAQLIVEDFSYTDIQRPHGVAGADRRWRVIPQGVHVVGEEGPRRTPGAPVTAERIVREFDTHVLSVLGSTGLGTPTPLMRRIVLATIATESRGNAAAFRVEKHDTSYGLMQTLTGTARAQQVPLINLTLPAKSLQEDNSPENAEAWRMALSDPFTSIALGTSYLIKQNTRFGLAWEPMALYGAYNAGGFYARARRNAVGWGFVTYGTKERPDQAADHFAAWFGDVCAVLRDAT